MKEKDKNHNCYLRRKGNETKISVTGNNYASIYDYSQKEEKRCKSILFSSDGVKKTLLKLLSDSL